MSPHHLRHAPGMTALAVPVGGALGVTTAVAERTPADGQVAPGGGGAGQPNR